VQGTTFVVPCTSQEIPNGVLQATTVNTLMTAANAYKNTAGIVPAVYSRPRPAHTGKHGPVPARNGAAVAISSVTIPTAITWLRTRRT
jgi:hypothetical protein